MKTTKEEIKNKRIGTVVKNITGYEMKCIGYRNSMDIDVLFLNNGYIVKNIQWNNFIRGKVKYRNIDEDEYYKSITTTKEYYTWYQMIRRCLNEKIKEDKPTYKDVACCDEWLYFENFYDWLHSQENFKIWKDLKWSAIDKDIFIKGNKVYSPDTCCLVPVNVNNLFVKHDALRGDYPIGVSQIGEKYSAKCTNPFECRVVFIGMYDTINEAFEAYKEYKENIIKEIADIEYNKGTITRKCRDAMYAYKVEIDD